LIKRFIGVNFFIDPRDMLRERVRDLIREIQRSGDSDRAPESLASVFQSELVSCCDFETLRSIAEAVRRVDPEIVERRRILDAVEGGRCCASYANPWRWAPPVTASVLQLKLCRRAWLRCRLPDPLSSEPSNWELLPSRGSADDDARWRQLADAMGDEVRLPDPDPEEDDWDPPRSLSCDSLDGLSDGSWAFRAPFVVYLHYPATPAQPPDGAYQVLMVSGEAVGASVARLAGGPESNARAISDMLCRCGGCGVAAVWLRRA